MKKMPAKQKPKKKKPKKQNPFFSFFTSFPGGTPYENPDSTLLRGLDMGADGPPGSPLEITHTHNGILKVLTPPGSMFNPSGRFLLQVLNLLDGPHIFGLRANSSSSPFHEWLLNVGAVETLTIASLKGLISGVEINQGTSTSETLFTLSGKARANSNIDLYDKGIFVAGPIAVDANGNWTYNTGLQAQGPHSYTVRGKYDSGPESTPPRTLVISQLHVENFDALPRQFIGLGQSIQTPTMTIRHISGAGVAGVSSVNDGFLTVPGKMEGNALQIGYQTTGAHRISLTLAFPCAHVSFWYGATSTNDNNVYFYGPNGLIGQRRLLLTMNGVVELVFAALGITRIEFDNLSGEWYLVDNISLYKE